MASSPGSSGVIMLSAKLFRPGVFLCSLVLPMVAAGAVYQGNPSNYNALLAILQPGDTLNLASGSYRLLSLSGLNGTPSAWITITGPASGAPAIITGATCCNAVEIANSSYLAIENLTIDSQGIDGVFGISAQGASNITHDILIYNNLLTGQSGSQQTSGACIQARSRTCPSRTTAIPGPAPGPGDGVVADDPVPGGSLSGDAVRLLRGALAGQQVVIDQDVVSDVAEIGRAHV